MNEKVKGLGNALAGPLRLGTVSLRQCRAKPEY